MLSSYLTGNLRVAASMSKFGGRFSKTFLHRSETMSSSPSLPELVEPPTIMRVLKINLASLKSLKMLALACRPYA